MSKKKKAKNSDYRYLQRHYDEQREEREKEERKKQKTKYRFVFILALILILGSLVMGLIGYLQSIEWMSPVYLCMSGAGMLLLYYYYKDSREKYAKTAAVFGIIILLVAFMQMRGLGWLKYLGFNI